MAERTVVELLDEMVDALCKRKPYYAQRGFVCHTPGCPNPALFGVTHPETRVKGCWCLWCLQRPARLP